MTTAVAARLLARTEQTDTCWLWQGGVNAGGYGVIWLDSKAQYVHRVSYEQHVGPIPAGKDVDHLCETKLCLNPEHLEPVPHQINTARWYGRRPSTHCRAGHELAGENVSTQGGRRRCMTCQRAQREARRVS